MEGTPKIVVVDDDAMGQELTRWHLARRFPSAAILGVSSAGEALEVLAQNQVDLVITDNSMRRMSGLELIREIRRQGVGVPIIMYTSSAELRDEALRAGANAFLSGLHCGDVANLADAFLKGSR